jgi:membrane protein
MEQQGEKGRWWLQIRSLYSDIWDFLTKDIWSLDLTKLGHLQAFGIRQAKVLIFVLRQFYSDKLLIRASSLTYSSLLAIVPFMAVVFSILKAIGLHMDLAPALYNFLAPLGDRGGIIAENILQFVANAQTSTLGLVGTTVLLLTVYGILNKIEGSYNDIWHVPQGRTWPRRLAGYTLLTVIGPLSLFLILALTASVTSLDFVRGILSLEHLARLFDLVVKLMPYMLSCLLFSIVIWFVPNLRVSVRAAIIGGAFSGILWQLSNWGFARFIAGATHASTRDILFAGFAALPLFLLWLYASWSILLLGAELGYVVQHVGIMEWRELEKQYGESLRRFVAVRTVMVIVRDSAAHKSPANLVGLAREVGAPEPVVRSALQPLVFAKIITSAPAGSPNYVPARDPARISMAELLLALRGEISLPKRLFSRDKFGQNVVALLREIDFSMAEGIAKLSLKEATDFLEGRLSPDKHGPKPHVST